MSLTPLTPISEILNKGVGDDAFARKIRAIYKRSLGPRPSRPHYWKSKAPRPHQRLIARVITTLRRRLGLTQVQLAEQLGVSTATVSRWEWTKGCFPAKRNWFRIRELWDFSKYIQEEEFLRDRLSIEIDFSAVSTNNIGHAYLRRRRKQRRRKE